ncbi:MAG: 50S ribosomal protein L25/general stress protein Ctc [Chitinophagales bacterium]|nr:50S ribosomal protein L25/general stress protein Ctc [Chitinophagales bacterium]
METLTISGQARADVGKKATKADRKNGNIPCVMYAGNEVVHFTTTMKDLRGLIYTPNFYKVAVTLDGTTHEAILKDVQVHPVTEDVLHVDFQKLIAGSKVFADIPVKLVGNAEGVKLGGKLLTKVRKLRVRSTPENLIDAIPVDVSSLNLGQSIKVKHIPEQKFQILNSPNIPIASVEIPRALRSKATADAAAKK